MDITTPHPDSDSQTEARDRDGMKILPRSAWASEISKLRIALKTKQVLEQKYGISTQ